MWLSQRAPEGRVWRSEKEKSVERKWRQGRGQKGEAVGREEDTEQGRQVNRGEQRGKEMTGWAGPGKGLGQAEAWMKADRVSGGSHLARLLVHVEGADDALGDLAARALHQVLGQPVGQVGLAGAAGAREHKAPVLEQQADVVLHHRLGDQRLKHQAVDALLLQT